MTNPSKRVCAGGEYHSFPEINERTKVFYSRTQFSMADAKCNPKRNSSWLDRGSKESDYSRKRPKTDCSWPESEFPESRPSASSTHSEVLKLISLEVS